MDHDVVEEGNLNRQVLYREEDIGKRKVFVASRWLREVNPEVDVIPVNEKINENFEFAVELGKFSEEMEVPDGITVAEFLEILKKRYPPLRNEEIKVSINGRYAREGETLQEDAIYSPISGG